MDEMPQSKDLNSRMDKKAWATLMLSTRDPPLDKRPTQTESKGLLTNIPRKWTGKKGEVAILISDKIDFKIKAIKRHTEGHFIILKGRMHQEDKNTVNIYAPNIGAPKYVRKIS